MNLDIKIPYALQDFQEIRKEEYLFLDKTKYIAVLEKKERYVLFLRPRRFGKTLFTSILYYYYDIKYKKEFDALFGGLYIGEHKTEMANRYFVLKFNFSGIDTRKEKIERSFFYNIKVAVNYFIRVNQLDIQNLDGIYDANDYITTMLGEFQSQYSEKIMILIDEYDHFANDILSEDKDFFLEITGKDGFIRKFYEVLKYYAGNVIERMFITGVTPIMLDALTSGFNIITNIGNEKKLNEMMGFTETDVKHLLKECEIEESLIDLLRENYNGYLFHVEAEHTVYNSTMLLYFLKEYQKEDKIPNKLVDINVISDRSKIMKLFDLYEEKEDRKEIITNILEEKPIESLIEEQISEFFIINSKYEREFYFSRQNFISLLYYLGLLTIESGSGNVMLLKVPNLCIKSTYAKYFLNYLHQLAGIIIRDDFIFPAIRDIVHHNNFIKFNQIVEETLRKLANVDYQRFDEKYVKVILFSLLNLSDQYILKSEYEMEGKRADLMLLPNFKDTLNFYYMIEIKYLSKESAAEEMIEKKRREAMEQILLYGNKKEVQNIPNFKKYIMIVVKDEIKVFEEV